MVATVQPLSLSKVNLPPSSLMTACATESPSPTFIPAVRVEKNGSKILSLNSSTRPQPLSDTTILAISALSEVATMVILG